MCLWTIFRWDLTHSVEKYAIENLVILVAQANVWGVLVLAISTEVQCELFVASF